MLSSYRAVQKKLYFEKSTKTNGSEDFNETHKCCVEHTEARVEKIVCISFIKI
jgi:hypothetical protein